MWGYQVVNRSARVARTTTEARLNSLDARRCSWKSTEIFYASSVLLSQMLQNDGLGCVKIPRPVSSSARDLRSTTHHPSPFNNKPCGCRLSTSSSIVAEKQIIVYIATGRWQGEARKNKPPPTERTSRAAARFLACLLGASSVIRIVRPVHLAVRTVRTYVLHGTAPSKQARHHHHHYRTRRTNGVDEAAATATMSSSSSSRTAATRELLPVEEATTSCASLCRRARTLWLEQKFA